MTIGEKIKKIRIKKGLSQVELARSIGKKTATYIAFIEKDKRNITVKDLIKITESLEVEASVFFSNHIIEWEEYDKGRKSAIKDIKDLLNNLTI